MRGVSNAAKYGIHRNGVLHASLRFFVWIFYKKLDKGEYVEIPVRKVDK